MLPCFILHKLNFVICRLVKIHYFQFNVLHGSVKSIAVPSDFCASRLPPTSLVTNHSTSREETSDFCWLVYVLFAFLVVSIPNASCHAKSVNRKLPKFFSTTATRFAQQSATNLYFHPARAWNCDLETEHLPCFCSIS